MRRVAKGEWREGKPPRPPERGEGDKGEWREANCEDLASPNNRAPWG